jgi:uncharacterized protein (TIGR03382 family)
VLHCRGGSIVCEQTGQASAETCDGQDNDCDGTADNGDPGGGGGCSTGLPGPCGAGVQHCRGGSIVCEQSGQASAEVCDGQDNDCDGTADNGDPGGGESCETGRPGVCAIGTRHCQGGELICVANQEASAEICDGHDNDCDGETDEDCVVDAGIPEEDAGSDTDAGTVENDGGEIPGTDGGLADGGWIWPNDVGAVTASGCGCSSPGSAPLLPAMIVLLGLFRRRHGH